MARYTGPSCRQCRNALEKLYLKGEKCYTPKCPVAKRKTKPGENRSKNKPSIFAVQQLEKQKVKFMYGLLETQFYRYFTEASSKTGATGENLLSFLERRLDNVIYRLRIGKSRKHSRQMVRHGNVLVNGKRVDIPSYRVTVGDKISLVNKEVVDKEAFKQVIAPSWLNLDKEKIQAEVVQLPKRDAIDYEVNEKLIVEFYSR